MTARLRQVWVLGLGLPALPCSAEPGAEAGYALSDEAIVVNRASHWKAWKRPRHAVVIDSLTQTVRPRFIRQRVDAIPNMDRFLIKIGDERALKKLLRALERENQSIPLNIRIAPATVAGVPIVDPKGEPVLWNFYHGGIREAPSNPGSADNILDGDPSTYWEPTSVVSGGEYEALPTAEQGPIYHFVRAENGRERRADLDEYEQAPEAQRRVQYHWRSLQDWYVEVDLGRIVSVSRIVVRFVERGLGEPFRQFRLLATPFHDRNAPLSLIARAIVPNEDRRVVEFDMGPDGVGVVEQIHRLRIAVTDSRFDRYRPVTAGEYGELPVEEQGGDDYYVKTVQGREIQVDEETFFRAEPERRGRRVRYQRERPRLADIEVWSEGDNVALGVIEGGGSVAMVGNIDALALAFDGLYDTGFSQIVKFLGSTRQRDDWGLMNLDLGAVFWIEQLRTPGCCIGKSLDVKVSDGARQASGELVWTQISRRADTSRFSSDLGDFDRSFPSPLRVRFLTSQLRLDNEDVEDWLSPDARMRVREFQLFGEGFASGVVLTSPLIRLPGSVALGAVEWVADVPDKRATDVEIRTRTGDELVARTMYYGIDGATVLESNYEKLPSSLKGPIVTSNVPGKGWSPWSHKYLQSGSTITSPSPRNFLQLQVKLLSQSPDLAPTLRSLRVHFLRSLAWSAKAEIWPDRVSLGMSQEFEVYLQPTFVEAGGEESTRFDELLLDASPMAEIELVYVSVGSEERLSKGTGQNFTEAGWRQDTVSGERLYGFDDDSGSRFKVLIDPDSGDTLKVLQGKIAGETLTGGPVLLLHLPRKLSTLPMSDARVYHRAILDEMDEVPVNRNGRLLNELLYLSLPEEERGRILYFEIRGRDPDGVTMQDTVTRFEYESLAERSKGEVRYFRRVGAGEFPFDRAGSPLSEAAYHALGPAERGTVLASGQMVRMRFRGAAVLHGTTVDVKVRDSTQPESWQHVCCVARPVT